MLLRGDKAELQLKPDDWPNSLSFERTGCINTNKPFDTEGKAHTYECKGTQCVTDVGVGVGLRCFYRTWDQIFVEFLEHVVEAVV